MNESEAYPKAKDNESHHVKYHLISTTDPGKSHSAVTKKCLDADCTTPPASSRSTSWTCNGRRRFHFVSQSHHGIEILKFQFSISLKLGLICVSATTTAFFEASSIETSKKAPLGSFRATESTIPMEWGKERVLRLHAAPRTRKATADDGVLERPFFVRGGSLRDCSTAKIFLSRSCVRRSW